MTAWIDRVITEKHELDTKRKALAAFLQDPASRKKVLKSLLLLEAQLKIMEAYSVILAQRLVNESSQ